MDAHLNYVSTHQQYKNEWNNLFSTFQQQSNSKCEWVIHFRFVVQKSGIGPHPLTKTEIDANRNFRNGIEIRTNLV